MCFVVFCFTGGLCWLVCVVRFVLLYVVCVRVVLCVLVCLVCAVLSVWSGLFVCCVVLCCCCVCVCCFVLCVLTVGLPCVVRVGVFGSLGVFVV